MPWGAGAVGGDRDVRGCASSWTEHGVMQEILSFPTKESCSKDHNLGEASTGDMSQAGDLLTTCFVGLGFTGQSTRLPRGCARPCVPGDNTCPPRHPPTNHRDKPTASALAPADTANLSMVCSAGCCHLKASERLSDTGKTKINHRRVCPWGRPVALRNKEEVEHSHRQ